MKVNIKNQTIESEDLLLEDVLDCELEALIIKKDGERLLIIPSQSPVTKLNSKEVPIVADGITTGDSSF